MIAAGSDVVVPRGKPHGNPRGDGSGHSQLVTRRKRQDQRGATEGQGERPAARDGIEGQKQKREDERRAEVLLQEEKSDGQRYAGDDRNGVLQTRYVKTSQPPGQTHSRLFELPEKFPALREIAGQKQD